jgi:peptidoglycan/xylan/chitin deacetylase (PgdA/CDA1 family)
VADLFGEIVTRDEAAFAEELYMSEDQIRYAVRNGFDVGAHGVDHVWLDGVPLRRKKEEIELAKQFLIDLGQQPNRLSIAYPYGAWDVDVLCLAGAENFSAGFTTQVDRANLARDDSLLLPRLDTNDLLDYSSR